MHVGLREHLEDRLQVKKLTTVSVGGGDINQAYLLHSEDGGAYFVKCNDDECAVDMLEKEADALNVFAVHNEIKVPQVILSGNQGKYAFLVLEYLESRAPTTQFWERFGQQLANFHHIKQDQFGWSYSNYIGTLHQSNDLHEGWPSFYAQERLLPQFAEARDQGLLGGTELTHGQNMMAKIAEICPDEPPSLVHGDLWSGNFIATVKDLPVLIDPAPYYGHREMDLAMSLLFGGFDKLFYQSYQACFPMQPGFHKRCDAYQLYYLLVHLNLFGMGYHRQVAEILKKYGH